MCVHPYMRVCMHGSRQCPFWVGLAPPVTACVRVCACGCVCVRARVCPSLHACMCVAAMPFLVGLAAAVTVYQTAMLAPPTQGQPTQGQDSRVGLGQDSRVIKSQKRRVLAVCGSSACYAASSVHMSQESGWVKSHNTHLQAKVDQLAGQHGGGGGAVARRVVGAAGDLQNSNFKMGELEGVVPSPAESLVRPATCGIRILKWVGLRAWFG